MVDASAVPSSGRNHLELMLLHAGAEHLKKDEFYGFCRNKALPQDLVAGLAGLFDFTHVCGFRLIGVGKIIARQIITFCNENPDEQGMDAVGAVIWAIDDGVPFVQDRLQSVKPVLDSQGRKKAAYESNRPKLLKRAKEHVRPFVTVMRDNERFFPTLPDLDVGEKDPAAFIDERGSYALGTLEDGSDNPFDLDEARYIGESTRAVVKFLIKTACADSSFDPAEKRFLVKAVEKLGEKLDADQYRELAKEAIDESVEDILSGLEDQTTSFKEHLLFLGMLAAAADGSVDATEKRVLAESLGYLGITKQRYAAISRDALAVLKSGR